MYREAYQRGMLTVFFSGGSKTLEVWETKTRDGYIKRFLDPEIKTMVLEIRGNNISTTYMVCPKGNQVLGITMPFLVMIVKNLMKYFSFEVTVLDSTGTRRRFRVSNFQSTTQILPLCTVMPIGLASGWNQIQFNLAEFTRRAYKNQFVEVQKLKINANIRVRRIYFTERLMSDDELPAEYKLYFPLQQKGPKVVKDLDTNKENIKAPSQEGIQEKKLSISDPIKSSIMPTKQSKKSLETVIEPDAVQEIKEIEDVATDTKADESAPESQPPEEELPGERETGEPKPTEDEKAPEIIEHNEEDEPKGAEDESDKKSEEEAAKDEADEKPGETNEKPDEEGDKVKSDNKLGGEETLHGENKEPDEGDKGESDEKPAEEVAPAT